MARICCSPSDRLAARWGAWHGGSAVNRADTGVDLFGLDLFSYAVDIAPLTLAAGTTFWLSIFNDTSSSTRPIPSSARLAGPGTETEVS
jgi:hypothetical protein